MRERDGLSAVLVACDLRNDLRCDVAGRRERMRLLDERAGDDRAILQHILKIDEVAVVDSLRVVVGIMEMDDAVAVRLHNVLREKDTLRRSRDTSPAM